MADVFKALAMVFALAFAALAADASLKVFEAKDPLKQAVPTGKAVHSVAAGANAANPAKGVAGPEAAVNAQPVAEQGEWGKQFHAAIYDEGSTFRKLHQLAVYALLAAVAVALGVFLFRLLAYLGIVDAGLPEKVKQFVTGEAGKGPAAGGKPGGLLAAALPVLVTSGAAAATLVVALRINPPDPVDLKVNPPSAVALAVTPPASVPVSLSVRPPEQMTQRLTFALDKSPLKIPITIEPDSAALSVKTVTVAVDAMAFTAAAQELSRAAAEFRGAATSLNATRTGQIGALAETSRALLHAAVIMNSDLQKLPRNSVITADAPPRRCSPEYFTLLAGAPAQDVAREARTLLAADVAPDRDAQMKALQVMCGWTSPLKVSAPK